MTARVVFACTGYFFLLQPAMFFARSIAHALPLREGVHVVPAGLHLRDREPAASFSCYLVQTEDSARGC